MTSETWEEVQNNTRGGTTVTQISSRKRNCNNEIYTNDSYIFCNYEAIFQQGLRRFQRAFAKAE
jgi:hypothetical protein